MKQSFRLRVVISCLMFFTLTAGLFSQTTVSGRIFSDEDRQQLPGATVSVFRAGSPQLVTGAAADDDGRFSVTLLQQGEYEFVISFVGYEKSSHRLFAGSLNRVLDLGNIFLTPSGTALAEVTVTGQRQSVSAALDKKSYLPDDFITGSASSVIDVMRNLPGVVIDQESRVILRGSDKVVVLIDGKQSSLTGFGSQKGLENIPASQIESIEIINNPSAKYDAAGMAGIVNIIFRKTAQTGFSGDAGVNPAIGMITKRKADLPTGMPSYSDNLKITPSLNVNYKTEKLNLYWQSYFTRQRRLPNNEFTTRFYDDGSVTESQVAENRNQNHYNLKLGLDWNPTPSQTLTLFGLYDYEWHIDTTRVWYFGNGDYLSPLRKWGFHESEGTGFTNVTLQHRYRFSQPGRELNSQLLFTKGWEDETYNLSQDGPPPFPVITTDKTRVLAPEYVLMLSSDYIRPLPFGRLEAGVQGKLRHMPITYTVTKNPANTALVYDFGNWSDWKENSGAGYVNLIAEFSKADIEAGVRGEYTSVNYRFAPNAYFSEDKYDYFRLFPNIRLTWKPAVSDRLSLFYNRRIDRPGEDILRIFPKYDDPELLKVGNPSLRPQFTRNMELSNKYMWSTGSFYSSVYLKITDDYYTRIYVSDPFHSEITVKGYDNTGRATNTGLEVSLEQQVARRLKISASANIYRNTIFAHTGEIRFPVTQSYTLEKRTDVPYFFKLSGLLSLPGGMRFEFTGQYYSARNIGQGRELARGGIDMGLKKAFASNRFEMNLSASDILNTMIIRQKINGSGFRVEYGNYYESQVFTLALRYRF